MSAAVAKSGEIKDISSKIADNKFLFNRADSARIMGVSVVAFDSWNVEPAAKSGRQKLYNIGQVVATRARMYEEKIEKARSAAKNNLDELKAEKLKIEIDMTKEKYIAKAEVVEDAKRLGQYLKKQMKNLRARFSDKFAAMKNPKQIGDEIEKESERILHGIAELEKYEA